MKSLPTQRDPGKPKMLLEVVRDSMRLKHYSLRTEETYVQWIKKFFDSFPLSEWERKDGRNSVSRRA